MITSDGNVVQSGESQAAAWREVFVKEFGGRCTTMSAEAFDVALAGEVGPAGFGELSGANADAVDEWASMAPSPLQPCANELH